jgi:putative thioredoxin
MQFQDYEITNFSTDVLERSKQIPVLVDFWAPWCGPCKVLGPILEKLAREQSDKWVLSKVNTDLHQDIALQYGIRGIPAVKLFVDGAVLDEFTGAMPEPKVIQWLQKNLPSQQRKSLAIAKEHLSASRMTEAQSMLEQVIEQEASHEEATALLAKAVLYSNPQKALELVKDIDAGSKFSDTGDMVRTIGGLLTRIDHKDSLQEGSARALYLQAIDDLKHQDFDAALRNLIQVIRDDRYYDNDGSRKACIAIFKYLGEEHEITLKHRRDFGSALYT